MSGFSRESLRRTLSKELGRPLSEQITRAFDLAYRAHDGQLRDQRDQRSKKIPYIVHPVGVSRVANELLELVTLDDTFDDIISACLTHDVLEDSEVTIQELSAATSPRTAELVLALTKPSFAGDERNVDRNELFIERIADSGATACFVKICDHIHNISRPGSTPDRLLEKALRKSEYYLQLFENDRLPDSLKLEYLKRLETATRALKESKDSGQVTTQKRSLPEAIAYCVEATKQKILELHDIADSIVTLTNAEYAHLELQKEFLQALFDSLENINQKARQEILAAIDSGSLDCRLLPSCFRDIDRFSVDVIYFLDVPRYSRSDEERRLFVGVRHGVAADWVTTPTLQMLVGYLCERLRSHERSRINALALDLARYRLDVDINDALQLQLSPPDLNNFRALLDQADFVREKLVHALDYHLRGGRLDKDLPLVSARVKSPRSISKKMITQSIESPGEVSDTLGIRIVCRSKAEANNIAHRATKAIADELGGLATLGEDAFRLNSSESSAGYRALHVGFSIPPTSFSPLSLGCEVQVRTVFEDAWARVSHDLEYKSDKKPTDNVRMVLHQLAALRDRSDELLGELD